MDRPHLGWKVAVKEWDEFTDMVADTHGSATLYAGIELERAWREYRDEHRLEGYANRLLDAAGLPRVGNQGKKPDGLTPIGDLETTRIHVRVNADVKQSMKQYAKAKGVPCHAVLRWVINWYREGGRDDRLAEKFERAVPEAEAALEVLDGGTDSLSATEKDAIAICQELPSHFPESLLHEKIDEMTSGTEYMHETRVPEVIDRMGVVRWKRDDKPDLFLPPEDRAELARRQAEVNRQKAAAEADSNISALQEAVADGGAAGGLDS